MSYTPHHTLHICVPCKCFKNERNADDQAGFSSHSNGFCLLLFGSDCPLLFFPRACALLTTESHAPSCCSHGPSLTEQLGGVKKKKKNPSVEYLHANLERQDSPRSFDRTNYESSLALARSLSSLHFFSYYHFFLLLPTSSLDKYEQSLKAHAMQPAVFLQCKKAFLVAM